MDSRSSARPARCSRRSRRPCSSPAAARATTGPGRTRSPPRSAQLGPGFVDRGAARPGVDDHAASRVVGRRPPVEGYRVVLLTAGDDPQTKTLADAVKAWADAGAREPQDRRRRRPRQARPEHQRRRSTWRPIWSSRVGNGLVDPLALVTANHLDQQFLVVGAELAEPTANVTAADWIGASFRGEGLGMPSSYDPASFTPQRAGRASAGRCRGRAQRPHRHRDPGHLDGRAPLGAPSRLCATVTGLSPAVNPAPPRPLEGSPRLSAVERTEGVRA